MQCLSPEAPRVSVVVPVYRNAATLDELYERLLPALGAAGPFELVFVDDACSGGSQPALGRLAARDARVRVIRLERNVGQHRAILAGLEQVRGAWTVVMDADLQDPPEAVPQLLERASRGDVAAVFAGRRGRYESVPRLVTSRLFKRLLHLLCGVPADAGLFVALDRSLVNRLLAMNGSEPFVVAMIGCTGLPMASIPVARARRPGGRSAYTVPARTRSAWRAVVWVVSWKTRAFLGGVR